MQHVDFTYTVGMEDDEVRELLREAETGVLALAKDDDAYAVPLAHYYDEGSLYFRLGVTEGSEKEAFIERTDRACYLVYDTEATDAPRGIDSWSVMVTGQLRELPPERRAEFDTAEINRRFSPIRVFDEEIDDIDIVIYELDVDVVTGRKTA